MCVVVCIIELLFHMLIKIYLRFYSLCDSSASTARGFFTQFVLLQVSVLKNWKETEVCKLNGIACKAETNVKMLKSLSRYGELTPEISVLLVATYK